MTRPAAPPELDQASRRALAAGLFNHTWTLLETHPRTAAQDDEMIHAAHASRYHWGEVTDDVHLARGEWQVARVYATLGRAEPALYHARRCVELAEADAAREDWDLAAAYEGMARACAVAGDRAAMADVGREGTRRPRRHRGPGGPDAHRGRPRHAALRSAPSVP